MTIKVLIPVHKEPVEFLRRSINSVLMQPVDGVEVLVLLSGADRMDPSRGYLDALCAEHPQVRLRVHGARLTASQARNALIDWAQEDAGGGHTIAFLDADDEWLPNHLSQYLATRAAHGLGAEPAAGEASLYSAPYMQRQSRRPVRPQGEDPTIWSLTRQPLLLSSMILTHIPAELRFRGRGAEDLIFYADGLRLMDRFMAGSEQSVIYDQGNWAQKTTWWKLKRSYRTYMAIFENPLKAAFFVGLFSVHYMWRRAFGA